MWFISLLDIETPRCVRVKGYYQKKDDAVNALNENWLNIHEPRYPFAALEFFPCGLKQPPQHREIYKWLPERKGFFLTDEPGLMKTYNGIAMG